MSSSKKPYGPQTFNKHSRISKRTEDCADYVRKMRSKRNFVPKIKESATNKVLRVTVWNAQYQVTTENLYYFFSQYGCVLRIVIFWKMGMPGAMVEFATVEGATEARAWLNGFEMYFGCNRLQIEFAWTQTLYVDQNDVQKCWDFSKDAFLQSQPPGWFQESYIQSYNYPSYTAAIDQNQTQQPLVTFASCVMYEPNVMMVTGLSGDLAKPDNVFNLLSLYGNVASIQVLCDRQGSAIIQMFDMMSVENCIRFCNNVPVGNYAKLQVGWANQAYPPNSANSMRFPDGSHSFKDYTSSKNQRFLIPRPFYWIQSPSKVVRFYNTPSSMTKGEILDIFATEGIVPKEIKILPTEDHSKLSRGLIEFLSLSHAVAGVMKCNNKEIASERKGSYFMKLCFSSSHSIEIKH